MSRGRRVEAAAEAPEAETGTITTSEDLSPEAEIEDAVEVGTDISTDGGVEVATEGDLEAETAGGEAEVVAGQEARGGRALGQGTGRGTRESPRRGIRRRDAMAKKLSSRRKFLRMAAQRMVLATSRKDPNPRAGKEKGQSHAIGKGQGRDHVRDPRGPGPEIAEDAPGLGTEESPNPGPGIGKDRGLVITRARRARGTRTRGRRSRGITIRKRRDTRTRRKKRPRQLTWRYPILREEGKSAILSDFSVAFYVHYTSNRLT